MPRNVIYVHEFKRESWNWRLEIIPASSEQLPEIITEIELGSDAVNITDDLQTKFIDKIPVGAIDGGTLKLEFDLLFFPDKDLGYYLINPVQFNAGLFEYGNYQRQFHLSNLFILKSDRGAGDTPINWHVEFLGVQKLSLQNKLIFDPDSITLELENINGMRFWLENIQPADISAYMLYQAQIGTFPTKTSVYTYDMIWGSADGNSSGYIGEIFNDKISGLFFQINDIDVASNRVIYDMKQQYCRNYIYDNEYGVLTIDSPWMALRFYKQSLTNPSRIQGSQLSIYDLWFLGVIYFSGDDPYLTENQIGGFLINAKDNPSIFNNDTLWDWYRDLTSENFCKLIYSHSRLTFLKIFTSLNNPAPIINFNNNIDKINEIEIGKETIRGAKCNISDIDESNEKEFSYYNPGSLAEPDFETKYILHNLPTLINPNIINVRASFKPLIIWKRDGMKVNKIYYFDTPPGLTEAPIRVHEVVGTDDGINAEAPSGYYFNLIESGITSLAGINGIILESQRTANIALAVAKAIGERFSRMNQIGWDPKIEFEQNDSLLQAGEVCTIQKDFSYLKYINDLHDNFFDFINTKAVLMETTSSIANEKTECKLLIIGSKNL